MKKYFYILALFCSPVLSFALSWDNNLRIINNYNQDLIISFIEHDTDISVNNCSTNNIVNYPLSALNNSCEFTLKTKRPHSFSNKLTNHGQVHIALQQDPNSYCIIKYSYNYTPNSPIADNYKKYSENFEPAVCYGNLSPKMISVINPQIEMAIRPVGGTALGLALQKPNAMYSFAMADCAGSKNCIIISPDLTMKYKPNGSTLAEALNLQANIDKFESFNIAQFIGVHNALVSKY